MDGTGGRGSRSSWMRALRAIAIAVAALVLLLAAARGGVAGYDAWRLRAARAALASEAGPLDPARLRPPAVAKADNAAYWVERAPAAAADVAQARSLAWRPLAEWSADDRAGARALVAREADALTLLARRRGAGYRGVGRDWTPLLPLAQRRRRARSRRRAPHDGRVPPLADPGAGDVELRGARECVGRTRA